MELNTARVRQLLKAFDFRLLFIEELGWDHHDARFEIILDGRTIRLRAFAQKRGMVAYQYSTPSGERLPDYAVRRKIEHQAAKTAHEHLIVFINADKTTQVWQWVRREPGKPIACREHTFHKTQPGDALIQKLKAIAFSLEEEETITLLDVTRRARAGFDVERVTKRFYDRFKKEHATFLKFVTGITEKTDHEWYASVMLNRLMFVYFIQRKGFLDGDPDYLRNRLARMQKEYGHDRFYSFYRYFLLRLFHEGLGGKARSSELEKLLGKIPYFDGGFFERHPVEERYPDIRIPDVAFERVFDYFDQYQWHLDERPLRADNEINPDVLGYIFEKYINQKQMGAYYTKEDITEYISKNTVIPFLFDAARSRCKVAFENPGGPTVWNLLATDPDRYLYPAVKHGVIRTDGNVLPEAELHDFVQTGMHDPKARMFDNRYNLQQALAGDRVRLVTETWREYVYRRNRCLEIREKLQRGEVKEINDLITFNLDIRQFAQDVIENCEGPDLLRAFWHTINGHVPEKSHEKYQNGITILDPTCGSGAFLFAALNILEPLYEACLDRMAAFVEDLDRSNEKHRPEKFSDFRKLLKQVEDHPNRRYYIFKNIILYNLFGVDIMEEAVEICKLRLFLKLVAQVEPDPAADNLGIEPLPDIDFNIRTGNTLVGYATAEEVRKVFTEDSKGQTKLQFGEVLSEFQRFEEQVELADHAFKHFRRMQIDPDMDPKDFASSKQTLREKLKTMDDELNRHLAREYGVRVEKKADYDKWLKSHQPFHWFVEFYGIMQRGGFDVIIGNPPYVETRNIAYSVNDFKTTQCGDLYALCMERSDMLLILSGRLGMIVPVSIVSTDGFSKLRCCLRKEGSISWNLNFAERPSKLFTGVEKRLTIWLMKLSSNDVEQLHLSNYRRWMAEERDTLFAKNQFVPHTVKSSLIGDSIPKVSEPIETRILERLSVEKPIEKYFISSSRHIVYYTRKLRYFVQFFNFIPLIKNSKGVKLEPSELKDFHLANENGKEVVISLLNSSLFFWFFCVFSDVRNVNKREINRFRFSLENITSSVEYDLRRLCKSLIKDFENNSRMLTSNYGNRGLLQIQSFQPRLSKPIIDQIDQVLAKHYGFTDEELDFIINYDIKYRMGRGADGGEEDN